MDGFEVLAIPSSETYDWLLYKHYAHRIPSISYAFGLYDNGVLVGVCTFGRTAFNEPSYLCGEEYSNIVYELNRLCINDNHKANALSYFVSTCLKMLPKPLIVISYSDSGQGHYGYIYQATNWIYTGTGAGAVNYITSIGKLSRSGMRNRETRGQDIPEIYSIEKGTVKHRYVYFIGDKRQVRDMKKNLKYSIEPYPKGESKRYDASYKPITQGLLL